MKSACILLFSLCLIVITNKVNARPQFNPLNPKGFSSRNDVKHQIVGQFPKKKSILYQSLPDIQPKPKPVPISISSKLIQKNFNIVKSVSDLKKPRKQNSKKNFSNEAIHSFCISDDSS